MANKFVTAIFGDYSKKEVKKVKKTIYKEKEYSQYTMKKNYLNEKE